ncbi:MAG: hypothetical protein JWP81_4291 [Ferruginibacter sp.]|nr:hypothetical protein [Ferruginibacter sp.]
MRHNRSLKKCFGLVFFLLIFSCARAQTAKELFNNGREFQNKKQYDQAIEAYTQAIAIDPNYTFAYNNRGLSYHAKKQYDLSIQDYNKAITIDPSLKMAYNNRGYAYQFKNMPDLAIQDYTKAVDIDPNYTLAYQNRGNIYFNKKQYDLARSDYQRAISLEPNNAALYYNLGNLFNAKKQVDSAISYYNQAIGLAPNYALAYYARGMYYNKKKEYDLAIADYKKAIDIDPDLIIAHNGLGLTYLFKGDYDLAVNAFKKAVSLDVNREKPFTIINIIEPLARLHRFSEAAEYFNDFRSKYVTGYIDTPYWLFFKKYIEAVTENLTKDDFSAAMNNLSSAEKLYSTKSKTEAPDDSRDRGYSSILALKGYVLERLNNNAAAGQAYEQALVINKSQPDVKDALQRLTQKREVSAQNDNTPPTINILEPLVNNRSISVEDDKVATTKQRIRGRVIGPGGIKSLKINNQPLKMEENGYFDTMVDIKPGINIFTILATDNHANAVSENVQIVTGKEKPASTADVPVSKTIIDYNPVYHAILIAETDYADKNIPSLQGPVSDMKKIYNLLVKNYSFAPENTDTLVSATRANILESIIKKANAMGENDNLFIFYAGHGQMITQPDKSEEGFLVPQDAVKGKLSSYISSDDLLRTIKYSNARHILFVADACFAGSLFRDISSEAPAPVAEAYKDKSRKLLASGNRTAVPDQSEFIEALRLAMQENRDKYITAEQLIDRFKNEYRSSTHLQLQYFPIKNVDDLGGQFVFMRK